MKGFSKIIAFLLMGCLLLTFCGCEEDMGEEPDYSDPNLDLTALHPFWQLQYYVYQIDEIHLVDGVSQILTTRGNNASIFEEMGGIITNMARLVETEFQKEKGYDAVAAYLRAFGNALLMPGKGQLTADEQTVYLNQLSIARSFLKEADCSDTLANALVASDFLSSEMPDAIVAAYARPTTSEDELLITFGGNTFLGNAANDWTSGFNAAFAEHQSHEAYYPFLNCLPYFWGDDLTVVTYEGNITGAAGDKDGYNGVQAYADLMAECGIDVVGLNTEHNDDFLISGLEDTDEAFAKVDIPSYYDQKTAYVTTKIGKIAFVSYNVVGKTPVLDGVIKKDMQEANRNRADIIIVNFHWGSEDQENITEIQEKYARLASQHGADLVIGSHPHLPQGVAYTSLGRGIFYSLGDLVHGGDTENAYESGYMVQVRVKKTDGRYSFTDFELIPIVRKKAFYPIIAKGTEKEELIAHINALSKKLKDGVTVR